MDSEPNIQYTILSEYQCICVYCGYVCPLYRFVLRCGSAAPRVYADPSGGGLPAELADMFTSQYECYSFQCSLNLSAALCVGCVSPNSVGLVRTAFGI